MRMEEEETEIFLNLFSFNFHFVEKGGGNTNPSMNWQEEVGRILSISHNIYLFFHRGS